VRWRRGYAVGVSPAILVCPEGDDPPRSRSWRSRARGAVGAPDAVPGLCPFWGGAFCGGIWVAGRMLCADVEILPVSGPGSGRALGNHPGEVICPPNAKLDGPSPLRLERWVLLAKARCCNPAPATPLTVLGWGGMSDLWFPRQRVWLWAGVGKWVAVEVEGGQAIIFDVIERLAEPGASHVPKRLFS